MNDYDQEIYRKAKILREGISESALNLLIEEFELFKPVFKLKDEYGCAVPVQNAEIFKLASVKRDGAHDVLKFIINMKKINPKPI